MLKRIEGSNFLLYGKVDVSLDGADTISVVGDNGVGKSALLEIINFVLFGRHRYKTFDKLVRIGTAAMTAAVTLEIEDGLLKAERSFSTKGRGSGTLKVWLDGNLEAKGGCDPSNNKAQKYIDTVLGSNSELFNLTSFFGLGSNDELMTVVPSKKLEALQRLAGAEVCAKFNAKASKDVRSFKSKLDAEKRALEVASENLADIPELETELKDAKASLKEVLKETKALETERAGLLQGLEETDRVTENIAQLNTSISVLDTKIENAKAREDELHKDIKARKDRIVGAGKEKAELQAAVDAKDDKLEETLEGMNEQYANNKAHIDLRERGVTMQGDKCPLCSVLLKDGTRGHWAEDIKKLITINEGLAEEIVEYEDSIKHTDDCLGMIDSLNDKIKGWKDETRLLNESKIKELDVWVQASEKKEALEDRRAILEAKLGELASDAARDRLEAITGSLTSFGKTQGALEGSIETLLDQIKSAEDAEARVEELETEIASLNKKMLYASLTADGFSRYNIPLKMLKSLRSDIEIRASAIYREFADGNILIQDVEGSRPGIDYVLVDQVGERAYEGLSEGQKGMVLLAIRVAITQRENQLRDNKVDFLILDEITGHLSPKKRDSLTKVIQKVLRKFFPQVFMVSHVPMRDIFTRTLEVEVDNGVSVVRG